MSGKALRRIARPLRAQWAGVLTIVLLLTAGTASALPGTNTILREDIVDGEVASADVADGSLTGRDVRTVAGGDLGRDALDTGQVGESSLETVPVASQAGSGRADSGSCKESLTYVDCGSAPVALAKPGRLLIIASVDTYTSWYAETIWGPCRLEINGAPLHASQTNFRYDDEGERTPIWDAVEGAGQHATLAAVTDVYPAGRPVVGVECALVASGEAYNGDDATVTAEVGISVVALSAG